MSDLVYNERTKLTATWMNGVSLALFAAGGFGSVAQLHQRSWTASRPAGSVGDIERLYFAGRSTTLAGESVPWKDEAMRPLVDYLPLLVMPAAGLIILVVGWIIVLRDRADRKRHNHPAE